MAEDQNGLARTAESIVKEEMPYALEEGPLNRARVLQKAQEADPVGMGLMQDKNTEDKTDWLNISQYYTDDYVSQSPAPIQKLDTFLLENAAYGINVPFGTEDESIIETKIRGGGTKDLVLGAKSGAVKDKDMMINLPGERKNPNVLMHESAHAENPEDQPRSLYESLSKTLSDTLLSLGKPVGESGKPLEEVAVTSLDLYRALHRGDTSEVLSSIEYLTRQYLRRGKFGAENVPDFTTEQGVSKLADNATQYALSIVDQNNLYSDEEKLKLTEDITDSFNKNSEIIQKIAKSTKTMYETGNSKELEKNREELEDKYTTVNSVGMAEGGLMLAPGGAVAKAVKSAVAPTAVALGTITSSEDAEAAYIPLEAFEQGTEAAINLFKRVKKLIDEGVEGEELYQKTGAFKDPDGKMKVDVAELKARDTEMQMAVGKFTEDAMKFLGSTAKSKKPLERTMGDYLPANSPVFENFPELANAKVIMRKGGGGLYGKYSPGRKEITVYVPTQADGSMYADPNVAMDRAIKAFNTLVHEFQHHIQDVKKAREVGYNTAGPMTSNVKKMQDDFKDLTTYLETDLSTPSLPFTRSEAEARLNQIKDFLMSQGITQKEFTENTASSIAGRVGYGIYVRELGEAEARSSGRKAFLTEADPTRKQVGVFYPATSEDPGTLEAVKMGSEQALAPEQILVRAHSYGSGPSAGDPLKFVNPETAKKSGAKTGAASAAALTGLAAATPSQAFVEELGFEDPTPTQSLIGDERLKDLPLEQQVLLDQVFVPKTKPYDILSGSPLGIGMMAADVIDMGFGDFLRGEGTEAGQRIRAEAKKKEEEQQDDSVEEMQAGGFVGDVYNQPYQPPQNLPPKNTDPSDDEMMQLNLRQGGGVETEAGVEMEQEGKKKFELDRKKADLNNDGELSAYEKARGEAIQKNMAEMNMGGMMSDPFAPLQVIIGIDGQSGNHIPAGSKAEEVRDDIPAMLSEGEYVMPADVVRWHGLKKMEELRCEAKNALGLMAKHDRIAMVDDDTKEPIEKEDIEYEIEEKDKPEVEEAEVEVVEAQTGADIQTTDPEGVEPLPPITYYRYETRWDPASNRYKRVPVDPITGETVTAETFERERASRYGLPQVFGEPKVRCPEGYEYDEEKQICMPIKSEQEQVAAAAQADTGDDGGAGAFTQGLATEPTGPTSLRDYTSYQAAEFLGPDRDLVTPEQALERMTTPTDVELPTGLSALSLPAQIMSRVGRFADAVGAQRAALQREDLIQASAQDIAEGKIDVGRLPTTYDFTFNPDTASFEKSRPSRITEITDVGGKPIVTGFDYVGSSGQTYTSEEVFEDDTKFEDVFGKGFERGTPSTGSFVQDTTALGVRSPDYMPSSEPQRKGSNASLQEPMPFGVPREMVDTTYTGMGAIDLPAYTPTTTPSFADVYDLGPIDTLGIMAPEPTTTVEPTVTEPTGPLTNREGDVVTTSTVTDRSGTTTTVTTTTDTDTGRSSSFLDSDKDGVKDSSERGVVTSRDGSPVTSGSGSVVTSRSEDQISGRDDNDDDGGGYDGPGSDPSDDGPSDSFGGGGTGERGSDGWGE